MFISQMCSTSACERFDNPSTPEAHPCGDIGSGGRPPASGQIDSGSAAGFVRVGTLLFLLPLLSLLLAGSERRLALQPSAGAPSLGTAPQVFYFPQIGRGGNFSTSFVFHNTGPDAEVHLSLFASSGAPLSLSLEGLGTGSEFNFPLSRGESFSTQTSGTGMLEAGYARVETASSVGGTAVFRLEEQGTGRSLFEAGVPESPLLNDFSIFVDSTGSRRTGLALAYPADAVPAGAASSQVQLRLFDENFQLLQETSIDLQPGEHQSFFVDSILAAAAGREASLVVHSEQPVAAVTLRQSFIEEVPGQSALVPLATFPVIPGAADLEPAQAAQNVFFFPQIGDGLVPQVLRFQTTLILLNTGADAQVDVDLRNSAGDPLVLDLGSLGTDSSFSFQLARGEFLSVQTPGSGGVQAGYAEIRAPSSVGGTAVFTRSTADGQFVLYEAGVAATEAQGDFSIVVDTGNGRDTGLALVHPSQMQAAGTSAAGHLRLYDSDFNLVAETDLNLDAGHHAARFVSEFFQSPSGIPSDFFGSLVVDSGVPLAAVTLLQNDDPQVEYPADIPNLTTLPVFPGRADLQGMADLSITKQADVSSVALGGTVNYTLRVHNNGPDQARMVRLVDTLPSGTTFLGASGSGWECQLQNRTVECTRDSLDSGATSTVSLSLTAPSAAGTMTNQVSVSSNNEDPNSSNDSASRSVSVLNSIDLATSITGPSSVSFGDGPIHYTVSVTNQGNSTATQVSLQDHVALCRSQGATPDNCEEITGITIVEVTAATVSGAGRSCSFQSNAVNCNLASISPGSTVNVQVTAEYDSQAVGRSILHSADASGNGAEMTPSDNEDGLVTQVFPHDVTYDISLSVQDQPDPVNRGETLKYLVTVANAGPGLATDVVVGVNLAPNLTFVAALGGCVNLGGAVRCDISQMAKGTQRQFDIRVKIPAGYGSSSVTSGFEVLINNSEIDTNTGNNGPVYLTTQVN